jgi:acyl-CoA hydrolase
LLRLFELAERVVVAKVADDLVVLTAIDVVIFVQPASAGHFVLLGELVASCMLCCVIA